MIFALAAVARSTKSVACDALRTWPHKLLPSRPTGKHRRTKEVDHINLWEPDLSRTALAKQLRQVEDSGRDSGVREPPDGVEGKQRSGREAHRPVDSVSVTYRAGQKPSEFAMAPNVCLGCGAVRPQPGFKEAARSVPRRRRRTGSSGRLASDKRRRSPGCGYWQASFRRHTGSRRFAWRRWVVTSRELGLGSGEQLQRLYPPASLRYADDDAARNLPLENVFTMSILEFERLATAVARGDIDLPALLADAVQKNRDPNTSAILFDQFMGPHVRNWGASRVLLDARQASQKRLAHAFGEPEHVFASDDPDPDQEPDEASDESKDYSAG